MHFDEISLAAAIRDAGIADGEAALKLAAALILEFCTPVPEPIAGKTIELVGAEP